MCINHNEKNTMNESFSLSNYLCINLIWINKQEVTDRPAVMLSDSTTIKVSQNTHNLSCKLELDIPLKILLSH